VQDPDGPLTVIVTPDQWEQVLVGEGDDPGWYVDELLGPRADDETFLVFYDGALCRSTRAKLPPVRSTLEQRRIAELRADPDRQVAWFAYPPDRPPPAAGRGALD